MSAFLAIFVPQNFSRERSSHASTHHDDPSWVLDISGFPGAFHETRQHDHDDHDDTTRDTIARFPSILRGGASSSRLVDPRKPKTRDTGQAGLNVQMDRRLSCVCLLAGDAPSLTLKIFRRRGALRGPSVPSALASANVRTETRGW